MKTYQKVLLGVLVVLLVAFAWYYPKLMRVKEVVSFFDEDRIVENFRTTDELVTFNELPAAPRPQSFARDTTRDPLPPAIGIAADKFLDADAYLQRTYTTGLLVLQHDTITYERYFRGHTAAMPQIVWSVSKSFLSTLFGIAVAEGKIRSIEQTVDEYCPELKGSGYEGVRIKDVLQMASGVAFNEDYADFWSDINRWGRAFAWGSSQDDFAAGLVRELEPGTYHHYVSINTHVLGMVLVAATERSIADYAVEKLWYPLGMEHDSYWLTDDYGMEMALGGLNTTVRNCAKLGALMVHEGNWRGRQLVPAAWVQAATTPDASHLQPGRRENSAHDLGYGYQWWIPQSEDGEYLAVGVYNQFIYVNPARQTVIVKHSANPNFTTADRLATTDMFLSFCRDVVLKERLRRGERILESHLNPTLLREPEPSDD